MKRILTWFGISLGVTAVSFFLLRMLVKTQNIELSIHGEIAMAIGVFFTFSLGTALMALIFYSNKNGHDDEVHYLTEAGQDNKN